MGQQLLSSDLCQTPYSRSQISRPSAYCGRSMKLALSAAGHRRRQFRRNKESEYSWPALTVARQPTLAMATAAVTAVTNPTGEAGDNHESFPTELVIRRSCGCPLMSSPCAHSHPGSRTSASNSS
jgi:hypothetical protein